MFKNPISLFYFVFGYVVIFSIWWAYLLFSKNEEAFKEKIEINTIYFEKTNKEQSYVASSSFKEIKEKYERQKTMILAEGAVFILLLIAGLLAVRRVLSKEIRLAKLQRNFMLSITHELKSPLAAIKLNMQTVKTRELDKAKVDRLMDNSDADVVRLEALIENILLAAKLESDNNSSIKEEINVTELAEMIIHRFTNNSKQIPIKAEIEESLYYETDVVGFVSMLSNLFENAIKYSESGSTIHFKIKNEENSIFIKLSDQGNGIPEHERKLVFEKFYRIGDENTRKSKGTGLGLFIVKKYIDLQKGTIVLSDNKPHGVIFSIYLPK
jgi:signal transduction histidine kinase